MGDAWYMPSIFRGTDLPLLCVAEHFRWWTTGTAWKNIQDLLASEAVWFARDVPPDAERCKIQDGSLLWIVAIRVWDIGDGLSIAKALLVDAGWETIAREAHQWEPPGDHNITLQPPALTGMPRHCRPPVEFMRLRESRTNAFPGRESWATAAESHVTASDPSNWHAQPCGGPPHRNFVAPRAYDVWFYRAASANNGITVTPDTLVAVMPTVDDDGEAAVPRAV